MSKNQKLLIMLNSITDWLKSALGIDSFSRQLLEVNRAILAQAAQLRKLEGILMTLAEKIKALVAVETEEGKKLQEANAKLSTALTGANEKIAQLEAIAGTVPGLQEQIDGLKAELAEASIAADAIAEINPTPVADGVVEEVIDNPDIETPPVVEEAPAPAPEVILPVEVVEAAIDALDSAE